MSKHAELIARLEAAEAGSKEIGQQIVYSLYGAADEPLKAKIAAVPYGVAETIDATAKLAEALFGERTAVAMLADASMEVSEALCGLEAVPVCLSIAILRALDAQEQK